MADSFRKCFSGTHLQPCFWIGKKTEPRVWTFNDLCSLNVPLFQRDTGRCFRGWSLKVFFWNWKSSLPCRASQQMFHEVSAWNYMNISPLNNKNLSVPKWKTTSLKTNIKPKGWWFCLYIDVSPFPAFTRVLFEIPKPLGIARVKYRNWKVGMVECWTNFRQA